MFDELVGIKITLLYFNHFDQCCRAEIIYFRLRLLFGSPLPIISAPAPAPAPAPALYFHLKYRKFFWFSNIKTKLQKYFHQKYRYF